MGISIRRSRAPTFTSICVAIGVVALAGCASAPAQARHLSSGCGDRREIALTFDDGPNPPYTDQILDILRAHGAKATFFDEGEAVEAAPELARREVAEGMSVGSHSYAHGKDLPSLSGAAFADDLRRAERALRDAVGYVPALYRPPFGNTSATMLRELRKAGYVSIGWDLDSRDWSDASTDEIVANVVDHAHPGAIVLMHDGGLGGGNPDRTKTIAALPRILDGLQAQGYAMVTVSKLAGLSSAQGSATPEVRCSAR